MTNILHLFGILEGKTERTRVVRHTFIEKDYTRAQLYFRSWLKPEDKTENFALYKLGEIEKENIIKPCKIFICGGYEAKAKDEPLYWRIKNREIQKNLKDNIEKYKKAKEEEDTIKQIKILFDGVVIKK